MSVASVGSPYRVPKRHDGMRSLLLAIGMHALLFVFLWGGIRWQSSEPVGVEAEVWDMTTQQAAPPPPPAPEPEPEPEPVKETPPPPPPPPSEVVQPKPQEPDIALQRKKEKEKQLEKERLAEEKRKQDEKQRKLEDEQEKQKLAEQQKKKEKEEADKAKKLAEKKEADRLAKARAAEMQRITGAAAGASTGTAAKSTAPRIDNGYVAKLKAKIQGNVSYTGGKQDVEALFRVTQLPTGEVISVRKIKSSGVPAYDAAVENAINKSSPLPKKDDGTVARELDIVFNLKDLP
jgi:colicin import membrane protein